MAKAPTAVDTLHSCGCVHVMHQEHAQHSFTYEYSAIINPLPSFCLLRLVCVLCPIPGDMTMKVAIAHRGGA